MNVTNNESFHQKAVHERLILEAVKDYAVFTTDLEHRITSWHAGAETLFGYAEADVIGQLAAVLYIPQDRPCLHHEQEKALAEGRAENERWHLRKDGSRLYGSGVVTPLRDETGTIVGLVKVMRDLTHQKQAEATRSQLEERFRAFVTATSDAVYQMSADWREMHQLVGKSFLLDTSTTGSPTARTSWLGRYIPPPDQAEVQRVIDEAIRDKKPFELAHRVIQADGQLGWTFSRAIPLLDQQGEITEWFGTASDITRQKQAEESLAQSEKEYRWLFNSIDEGFCTVKVLFDEQHTAVDYYFLEANPAFIRQTGLENAIGKSMRELVPEHEPFWFEAYGRIARTGEAMRFEHQAAALGRFYDVYAFRVGESADHSVAILFNDITDRKRHEANLTFLAEIGHDLARLTNIDETMQVLGAKIGAYFGAAVCAFSDVDQTAGLVTARYGWHRPDAISPTGVYRLAEYHSEEAQQTMRAGRPEIVHNTASLPEAAAANLAALNIGAFVNIPLVREGQWQFTLSITDSKPRHWRTDELDLLDELITRIWTRIERARAEEALAKSERFVQGMVTSLPLVIYIFDLVERRNHYLSPQVVNLSGYTLAAMQASGNELIQDFFHPDDRPRLAAYFAHISSTSADAEGQPSIFQIECRVRHRERGWVWVQCRDTVYQRDAQGHPTLLLGTAEDITERRRTNEALQESEKRFRLAIEAAELGTWEWDLLTNEVFWNEQHFRLFGMQSTAAVPQLQPISYDVFLNHIHPNDRARVTALLQRAIADRSVYDTEFCALLDDGSERWMSGYGRIVEEQGGNPVRMSGVMFDIDERKRAEDALRLADQRKNEFLSLLSHELRNPLATLSNTLLILKLTGGTHEAMTLPMATTLMRREVTHLVRLVDDLLDVSRISRGKIVLTKKRADLVLVVREAAEAADGGFRAAHRTLTIDLPTEPVYLLGDTTRLKQVVSNLLNNALKFTYTGGHIWVSLDVTHQEPDGPMALLRVRDDGIGIADHEHDRIFQMFVQVDSSLGRTQDGLGLGLTLVSELVGLHGGRVVVQSEGAGRGSEFIVYLPVESENNIEDEAL